MTEHAQDRKPTPDRAEDNAFFPSPYSLSQYTSDKTDYDGLATEEKYTGGRWKILVIATDERYMLMQNGTFFSTGNHPVETLLPIHHMAQAGYGIDIATISGGPGKIEWWAFPGEDEAVKSAWAATKDGFKAPEKLAEVIADGLEDYAAIFIPGGHGAMNGIPSSTDLRDALDFFLDNDRLVITLCHGPAALLAAGVDRDANPFAGYEIVAFPDALDLGANVEIGYLPGKMPWNLGERLQEAGIEVINGDMTGATTRDRNLLSGDSPLAAHQLGKDSALALLEKFNS
ncbi:glyoxalase III HchA [Saccharopolyspora hirsuta]|uniref:Protein deglycase HchA n=1 Tax=Saccharopolyspora hirsuta TaxID=1837 RepID=A0A5M7C4S7_SACHI|nr:glyoxalase III HchA [Saccharopolyspora hirsuta]KAA5837089.1 protein deglycase HchA [Saccharopolyspora hirsuta]